MGPFLYVSLPLRLAHGEAVRLKASQTEKALDTEGATGQLCVHRARGKEEEGGKEVVVYELGRGCLARVQNKKKILDIIFILHFVCLFWA